MAAEGKRTAPGSRGSAAIAEISDRTLEDLQSTEVPVVCRDGTHETIHVGRLYLDQLLGLSAAASEAIDEIRDALNKIQRVTIVTDEETKESRVIPIPVTWQQMAMAIIPAIKPETAAKMLSVLTDRDAEWVRRNCDLVTIANIVDAVSEHNPIEQIMAAFSRAASRWSQRQSAASSQTTERPSPPSESPNGTSDDTASHG